VLVTASDDAIRGMTLDGIVVKRQYDTERVRKDGTRIAVALTITPIRGRDGVVTGAAVVARDISARKAVEEALRASEERYRLVEEHAPTGMGWLGGLPRCAWAYPALRGPGVGSVPGDRCRAGSRRAVSDR
jgi:PAS domain-containing protein